MRNSRKWMIAFVAIVLLTLTVSGGALAAVDDIYYAKSGAELWQYNSGIFTFSGDSADIFYLNDNIGVGKGSGSIPGTVFDGYNGYIKISHNGQDGYVAQAQLLYNSSNSEWTANANEVWVYRKALLINSQPIGVGDIVVEMAMDTNLDADFPSGYIKVKYGSVTGYVKAELLQKASGGGGGTNPGSVISRVTIGNNGARIYKDADSNSNVLATIPSGTRNVGVYEAQVINGVRYLKVSYTTGGTTYTGWILESATTNSSGGGNWGGGGSGSTTNVAYVTGGSLALRNTPDGDVIRWYPTGTAVRVTGNSSNGWTPVEIVADSNAKGYMMTKYLDFKNFSGGGIGNPGSGWGGGSGGSGTNPSQPLYATVNNPAASGYVNLRRSASSNSDILGRFNNGQQVIILTYNIDWCQVQIGNLTGYMQTSLLKIGSSTSPSPTAPPSTSNPVNAVVNNPDPTHRLNLRAQASTSSTSLGRYYNGTQVKVYERGSTWCYVEVQGIRGYMMTQYLSFDGSYNSGGGSSGGSGGGSSSVMYAVVKNPVSTQKLNLRAQPTTSSTSLGQFYNGTAVTVTRYGTEWCEVTVNGIKGYMMTMYLSFSSGTPSTSSQYAVIKNPIASQYLNLRASADINSRSLGQFYNGTSVKILEYGMTWCRVEINGIRGYMMTRYLQMV